MWIHEFLHRCTFSSHLLNWILKAMQKQTELVKTNLIKIRSLPPHETLVEFPKLFTPSNWFLEQSTRCFEIDIRSHKQSQRWSEIDTQSPPNSNWCPWITHDPTPNLGCSDTNCCAYRDNNLSENPPTWRRLDAAGEATTRQEQRTTEKSNQHNI